MIMLAEKAELSYQLAKTKGHLKSLLATASNQHLLPMLDQVNGELRQLAHLNFPKKVLFLFFSLLLQVSKPNGLNVFDFQKKTV